MAKPAELSTHQQQIAEICARYGVRELMLFGSATGAGLRPDSDLDFLVEFAPGVSVGLVRFGQLQQELETALGRKVDLVPKRGLKRVLRESVLANTKLIYAT